MFDLRLFSRGAQFKQIKGRPHSLGSWLMCFQTYFNDCYILSEAGQCFSQYISFSQTHQIESCHRVSCRFELIFGNGVRTGYIICVTHCVWCCFCARRNYDPGLHKSQAWRQYDVGTGTEIRACTYCTPSTF